MKVEDIVDLKGDYLFWEITSFFLQQKQYRILSLSKNQNELWLENLSNKQAPIIRLLRYDINWSNWIRRDLQKTGSIGERIRRKFLRRKLTILNIYLSTHPPVDDCTWLKDSYHFPAKRKVTVETCLIDHAGIQVGLSRLREYTNSDVMIDYSDKRLYSEEDVRISKSLALNHAEKKQQQDNQLFHMSKPFFTYVFLALQVMMFLWLEWQGGSTDSRVLVKYGAKYNPLILEGEWWRFFTPVFLHIGLLHLVMNSIALLYIGSEVERMFGNLRFVWIYLVAGMFGSIASFLFTVNISAGASGAIFGCFGALLYFGIMYPQIFFRTMGMNVIVIISINLLLGFTIQGIDNAGHIGGLVGGIIATGMVHFPNQKNVKTQIGFILGSMLLLCVAYLIGFS
ncbi:rhomboid family intramembrane serine protease [Bacillus sp. 2205SS5-2]|uniref:rhomboid family intramembrane serine protease n=1 Tax=Bacillus sp. 2205SS5-2 TaxID=3109031 RepID=UPI003005BD42